MSPFSIHRHLAAWVLIWVPMIAAAEPLGGVPSLYTGKIESLVSQARANDAVPEGSKIELKCWSTPGHDLYIGVEQHLLIEAPLKTVSDLVDDFGHYQDWFPGFSDIHEIHREASKSRSYWEQTVPLPFVPNVKWEMIYAFESPSPEQRLYRFQLGKSSTLVASDGFILLKAVGDKKTSYTEFDFFDAHWGGAKMFGHQKLWRDAVEGIALSDLGFKLKAENPSWEGRQVRRKSRSTLDDKIISNCVEQRRPFAN